MTRAELATKLEIPEDWLGEDAPVLTRRAIAAGFRIEDVQRAWAWTDSSADLYGGGAVMLDGGGKLWIASIEEHGSRLRLLTHDFTISGPLDADAMFRVPAEQQDLDWLALALSLGVALAPGHVQRVWEELLGCRGFSSETAVNAPAAFSFSALRKILWSWRSGEPRFGALVSDRTGWVWYLAGDSRRVEVAGPSDLRRAFAGLIPEADIAQDERAYFAAKLAAED